MIDWIDLQLVKLMIWFDSILFELNTRLEEGLEEERRHEPDGRNRNI